MGLMPLRLELSLARLVVSVRVVAQEELGLKVLLGTPVDLVELVVLAALAVLVALVVLLMY